MSDKKSIRGQQTLNILAGISLMLLSILVFIFSQQDLLILLEMISVAVIIISLVRIIGGFTNKNNKSKVRILRVITGIITLIIGVWVLILILTNSSTSIKFTIGVLASALLISGISRFTFGFQASNYPIWFRVTINLSGLVAIGITIIIYNMPSLEFVVLIIMLSIILLINGIARISMGVVRIR